MVKFGIIALVLLSGVSRTDYSRHLLWHNVKQSFSIIWEPNMAGKDSFRRPFQGGSSYNLNPELLQRIVQAFQSMGRNPSGGLSPISLTNTTAQQPGPTQAPAQAPAAVPKPTAPPAPPTPTADVSQPSKLPTGATTPAPSAMQQIVQALVSILGGGQAGGLDTAIAHGLTRPDTAPPDTTPSPPEHRATTAPQEQSGFPAGSQGWPYGA
jgi:hypothetical protein